MQPPHLLNTFKVSKKDDPINQSQFKDTSLQVGDGNCEIFVRLLN